MVTLNFTLMPSASAALHDALVCLAKFSETVSIEARRDRLSLTALNSSKSAYASFALEASKFFSNYEFSPSTNSVEGRFTCRIMNKALISVFKGRQVDPRGRDTVLERCEVSLQDRPDEAECRLIIRMVCNQGVTKTYKLTYESVEVMHALFDKASASNRWSIRSSMLRETIEYFGSRTEQLDMYAENGRVTYTSFTEKITNGRDILKHPLQTSVAISASDFDHFEAVEKMHVIISVKDFKAIVTHADTLKTKIKAFFSQPTRPLQFSYSSTGMLCEFTLMTIGDYQAAAMPAPAHAISAAASSRAPSAAAQSTSGRNAEMPPPSIPASRTSARLRKPPGSAKQPSLSQQQEVDSETLFVQQGEGDHQWDPTDYRDDEETLGWDVNADSGGIHPTFRDSGSRGSVSRPGTHENADGLAPTQRLSQIPGGLW
ncbi:DNA repair protein Rad9 [Saccharata proteae CBS 121410]|uniref:DNA repair protein rad9 n=1 Tax=Saccharata proteae CBS 121410 TaxID=1314787 RepID=A0A9P4HW43_9PEZI|nr:DNA repair protein Rad9 [Saccharata proteae CBS 121410]